VFFRLPARRPGAERGPLLLSSRNCTPSGSWRSVDCLLSFTFPIVDRCEIKKRNRDDRLKFRFQLPSSRSMSCVYSGPSTRLLADEVCDSVSVDLGSPSRLPILGMSSFDKYSVILPTSGETFPSQPYTSEALTRALSGLQDTTNAATFPWSSGCWHARFSQSPSPIPSVPAWFDFMRTLVCSNVPWEVVIVDDASPDGTQEVARQLQKVYGDDHVVS
jgi:hypothetical protein